MVHRDYLPRVGDLARLVWGISRAPTPWFASRIGVNTCCTYGGVTLFKLLGYDAQLFHASEALEREVYMLVV